MTQPVWLAEPQVGMFLKLPPTSLPVGTCTLPPKMMADTILWRSAAEGLICDCSNLIRMAAPWECPMKTTGRPSLSWAR